MCCGTSLLLLLVKLPYKIEAFTKNKQKSQNQTNKQTKIPGPIVVGFFYYKIKMSPVNNLGTVDVYTKKVKPRLCGANGGASVKCAGKVQPLP